MRLLVLAPHPDDEILGCAAFMQRVWASGGALRIVVVTDGSLGGGARDRADETQAALAALGLPPAEFWDYPDGALPLGEEICARYRDLVRAFYPTHLALPNPGDGHPDHRRLCRGVLTALTGRWAGDLMFYETTTPMAQCNHFEPVDLQRKCQALTLHRSQMAQFDYQQWVTGLATLRGANAGCKAAEGYLRFTWDGSAQNFFEHQPLVSVLVRSNDAALLALALGSIAAQEYDQLEVIVIWHGEDPRPKLPPLLMGQVLVGPGGRAANLNLGLEHARGEYLAFLDQDDVWLPNHLAALVTELQSDALLDLAYGDYERVVCVRDGDAVHVQSTQPVATEVFCAGRLMLGNHIPLNSYVCRLRRARQIRFNEGLDAYEDWDFLLRAELDGWQMRRVQATVAEYRLFPRPDQSVSLDALHLDKGYLSWTSVVRRQLFDRLSLAQFETLLDYADGLRSRLEHAQERERTQEAERTEEQTLAHELKSQAHDMHQWADVLVPASAAHDPWARILGLALHDGPLISVLMPVCDPEPRFFAEAVQSLMRQTYPRWELCLCDDASTSPEVLHMLQTLAQEDRRVRIKYQVTRVGIVGATMGAWTMCTGNWITFVDHDDRLHPNALLEVVKRIHMEPQLHALYTDSDTVDRNGQRVNTFHKPDWSPETLLHLSYTNHLSVVRRDVFERVGALTVGLDGCQDWDLWLRLAAKPDLQVAHIAQSLYDWRASETSTAYSLAAKPYVLQAALQATQAHLMRLGLDGGLSRFPQDGFPGARHHWDAMLQPMTVVVLTHRNPDDLQRLVNALQHSTYPNLSIKMVANRVDAHDARTVALLDQVRRWSNAEVRCDDRPFNWAALNNRAALDCSTPWLLFLNDDVCWEQPDTLERLARYLNLSAHIGVVGMRLVYGPEAGGGIQHDGIITSTLVTQMAHNVRSVEQCAGLNMPRNVSAVTGACLLTTRAVFDACGGFDERFPISFNDVDYCLHARHLGYRVVQASDVTGTHRESRTRGLPDTLAKLQEIEAAGQRLHQRWGDALGERYRLHYARDFVASFIVRVPGAGAGTPP